jgi:hypothetical protein
MVQNHQYHQGFSVIRSVLSPGLRYIVQSTVKQKNYGNVTSESEIWALGTRTSKDRGVFSFDIVYDICLQAPRKTTQNIGKLYLPQELLIELHPYVTCSIRIKLNQSTHLSFKSTVAKVQ